MTSIGTGTLLELECEINVRIAKATPEAAFALGILAAFTIRHGVKIPAVLLDGAMEVKTMRGAVEYGRAVWEMRDGSS